MLKTFFNYMLFGMVCVALTACMLLGFVVDAFKYLLSLGSRTTWKLVNFYLDKLIEAEIQLKKFKKGVDKVKKM